MDPLTLAYIHVLEEGLVALRKKIRDAADWYDRIIDVLPKDGYVYYFHGTIPDNPELDSIVQELCKECYARDYGEHLSERQLSLLLTTSKGLSACRYVIYYVIMSRVRAGLHIAETHVKLIHSMMTNHLLITSMCLPVPAGEINMHKLCKEIGHPEVISQRGCMHDPYQEKICDQCITWLRTELFQPAAETFIQGLVDLYVPDAYLMDPLSFFLPSYLIKCWGHKNAQFRKYNIRILIMSEYSVKPLNM